MPAKVGTCRASLITPGRLVASAHQGTQQTAQGVLAGVDIVSGVVAPCLIAGGKCAHASTFALMSTMFDAAATATSDNRLGLVALQQPECAQIKIMQHNGIYKSSVKVRTRQA